MRTRIRTMVVLGMASIAVASLIAELGLRLIGFSRPNFYGPDQVVGARLRPGASGWDRREGNAWVSISSQGLRDREHSPTKETNTLRVAVLGDSFSEAFRSMCQKRFGPSQSRA